MRRHSIIFLIILTVAASAALAQNSEPSQQGRKVVSKVTPVYPDLAKGMQISGVVKLLVTVSPSGSVKSIEPVGGNPVFIKAAQDAVRVWKYARTPEETREVIELRFNLR